MKNSEIGKRIKDRRNCLGISVIEIAERTGLSRATIHRYESGEIANIKLPVIETIADILNVNSSWLIGKSNNKTIYEYSKEYDLDVIIRHALKAINSNKANFKGNVISKEKLKHVENTFELSLALLNE